MPGRDAAWDLLCEFTASDSLRKHALAVEACVRAYARKFGDDEELWGLAALLHDFDYERWPNNDHRPTEEHPFKGSLILRERGYPEGLIRAILSHADYTGIMRQSRLEHTLFACDELAGFPDGVGYYPNDVAATIYHALGIDPHSEMYDFEGRPMTLCDGAPIAGLF
jgi:putative nucleotidyltransferase with HDIG domain